MLQFHINVHSDKKLLYTLFLNSPSVGEKWNKSTEIFDKKQSFLYYALLTDLFDILRNKFLHQFLPYFDFIVKNSDTLKRERKNVFEFLQSQFSLLSAKGFGKWQRSVVCSWNQIWTSDPKRLRYGMARNINNICLLILLLFSLLIVFSFFVVYIFLIVFFLTILVLVERLHNKLGNRRLSFRSWDFQYRVCLWRFVELIKCKLSIFMNFLSIKVIPLIFLVSLKSHRECTTNLENSSVFGEQTIELIQYLCSWFSLEFKAICSYWLHRVQRRRCTTDCGWNWKSVPWWQVSFDEQ